VHREEEKIGRLQELDRGVVRQIAMRCDELEPRHRTVGLGKDPCEMHLDPALKVGSPLEQLPDGLKEVDVRPGSGVQPLHGASQ
jgi:hypothetical protein